MKFYFKVSFIIANDGEDNPKVTPFRPRTTPKDPNADPNLPHRKRRWKSPDDDDPGAA